MENIFDTIPTLDTLSPTTAMTPSEDVAMGIVGAGALIAGAIITASLIAAK